MAQNRTISEGEKRRPTPQSLPRLTIPKDTSMEPEAITLSRMTRFLTFCDKYGARSSQDRESSPRRPGSKYFEIAPDDDEEPTDYDPLERYRELATDDDDDDIPTLEFDLRDRRELERKTRQLEDAKEQHGRWIRRLGDDPQDQEVLRNCRRWRKVREEIGAAIALIPERLRVRREFREEFNPRWAAFE
ncbi:hypothetical protein DL770_003920 [Monosporascus sp. CRB-9-2]|nr:hypothetical protein DL770_003920 [Monosporascus sp. CRB-9-2]